MNVCVIDMSLVCVVFNGLILGKVWGIDNNMYADLNDNIFNRGFDDYRVKLYLFIDSYNYLIKLMKSR